MANKVTKQNKIITDDTLTGDGTNAHPLHSEGVIGDGVLKITVGTIEPVNPTPGDLWVDTN